MGNYDYKVPKGRYVGEVTNLDMRVGSKVVNTMGDEAIVTRVDGKYLYLRFITHRDYCHLEPSVASSVVAGGFKDWFSPTVYGAGVCGYPPETNGDIYYQWKCLIHRVEYRPKKGYRDVRVGEDFICFQDFYYWYKKEEAIEGYKYELDKDLFSYGGELVYTAGNCCLIPREINNAVKECFGKKQVFEAFGKYHFGKTVFGELDREDYFDTPEECVEFYGMLKKHKLISLTEKYKDVMQPHVVSRLRDLQPKIQYNLVRK